MNDKKQKTSVPVETYYYSLIRTSRTHHRLIIMLKCVFFCYGNWYKHVYSGCKACGRQEIESGCNGEGRIQGGIATVPGFGWWPIKAYRPCPGFVESGGRYMRQGQSMDEVAGFGRVEMAVEKTVPLVQNVDEPPPR